MMKCALLSLASFLILTCPPRLRADEASDRASAARVGALFETWDKADSPGCAHWR